MFYFRSKKELTELKGLMTHYLEKTRYSPKLISLASEVVEHAGMKGGAKTATLISCLVSNIPKYDENKNFLPEHNLTRILNAVKKVESEKVAGVMETILQAAKLKDQVMKAAEPRESDFGSAMKALKEGDPGMARKLERAFGENLKRVSKLPAGVKTDIADGNDFGYRFWERL